MKAMLVKKVSGKKNKNKNKKQNKKSKKQKQKQKQPLLQCLTILLLNTTCKNKESMSDKINSYIFLDKHNILGYYFQNTQNDAISFIGLCPHYLK